MAAYLQSFFFRFSRLASSTRLVMNERPSGRTRMLGGWSHGPIEWDHSDCPVSMSKPPTAQRPSCEFTARNRLPSGSGTTPDITPLGSYAFSQIVFAERAFHSRTGSLPEGNLSLRTPGQTQHAPRQ